MVRSSPAYSRATMRDLLGADYRARRGNHADAVFPARLRQRRPIAARVCERPIYPVKRRPMTPRGGIKASEIRRRHCHRRACQSPRAADSRSALARGIVTCRMYASFDQVVHQSSNLLSCVGRKPWRLTRPPRSTHLLPDRPSRSRGQPDYVGIRRIRQIHRVTSRVEPASPLLHVPGLWAHFFEPRSPNRGGPFGTRLPILSST